MTKTWNKIKEIIKKDPRYLPQAYQFVFEALDYTTNILGKNQRKTNELERHVTGKQLMEGLRQYAIKQFGFMALTVFEQWGVKQDADFGNIVFNLVESGLMGKTETDSREDFKNTCDLKKVFDEEFKFDGKYDIQLSLNALGIKKR
ncbi:MAG: Minf_1886 family protein [Planctomycetota bacterium]